MAAHPRRPRGYKPGQCNIFGRKFTSRAEEPLGTYSYRTSFRSGRIPSRWLGRKYFSAQSAMRSSRVTLSPSYTKGFSSSIDLVVWPVQREDCFGEIQRSRGNRKPWHQFSRLIYRRYIVRKFLWTISTLLFLVAGKASRVLVDRWITSETFHDVQNVNRRWTGHATMLTERGNYRVITVHAPIAPNQKSLSNCCVEALEFYQKILYLHVSHKARL